MTDNYNNANLINVGGVLPFTTIDFPNHIACVLFLQGCPWRCPYCHNQHLLNHNQQQEVAWSEVIDFLNSRVNLLDGVVFSGGEPLFQQNIYQAISTVKSMGFFTALHTNGFNPEMLEKVLPLLSWVGLDIKNPFHLYNQNISKNANGDNVNKSLNLIANAGIPFEIRTTLDPRIINKSQVLDIAKILNKLNVQNYALQQYRPFDGEQNIPSIPEITQFFTDDAFIKELKSLIPNLILREV